MVGGPDLNPGPTVPNRIDGMSSGVPPAPQVSAWTQNRAANVSSRDLLIPPGSGNVCPGRDPAMLHRPVKATRSAPHARNHPHSDSAGHPRALPDAPRPRIFRPTSAEKTEAG